MEIILSRTSTGFSSRAVSNGRVILSLTASTWFDAWIRLARVLSLLRIKHSLKFQF